MHIVGQSSTVLSVSSYNGAFVSWSTRWASMLRCVEQDGFARHQCSDDLGTSARHVCRSASFAHISSGSSGSSSLCPEPLNRFSFAKSPFC